MSSQLSPALPSTLRLLGLVHGSRYTQHDRTSRRYDFLFLNYLNYLAALVANRIFDVDDPGHLDAPGF